MLRGGYRGELGIVHIVQQRGKKDRLPVSAFFPLELIGTPYDKVVEFSDRYASDGLIWFLECCDLGPLDLRRAMWHMKQAGWFDKANGFIIGRSLRYGEEMMGVDMYNAVVDTLSDLNIPILMDADVGHHPPMLPLICGSYATVVTVGNGYSVTMELK